MRISRILLVSTLILIGTQVIAADPEFIFRGRPGLVGLAGNAGKTDPLALALPPLPPLTVGAPWSAGLSANGGNPSQYVFSVTPPVGWLSVDPASGLLSGTPDSAGELGVYTFTVTDGENEDSASVPLTASDPLFASVSDVAEGVGAEISRTVSVVGGKSPYSFSWTEPSEVPSWLGLSADGTLSGTATTSGDWLLRITVSDADGRQSFTDISVSVQDVSYWTSVFGGSATDNATDLAVADDGSVYVAGDTASFGTKDILLMKYDPDGSVLWARTLGSSDQDGALAVSVGPGGTVYVAGLTNSQGTTGGYDALVAKYSSGGNLLWKTTFGFTPTSYDQLNGIDVAPDGSIYVTGMTDRSGNFDMMVARLAPSGNIDWVRTAGASFDDRGLSVKVAGDGSFYVVGHAGMAAGNNDILVAKFDAAGSTTWAKTIGGTGADYGRGLAVRGDGSVVISGYLGSPQDAFLASLSPQGQVLSSGVHGGPASEVTMDVLLGEGDDIFVAGYTNGYGQGDFDVALMAYSDPRTLTGTRLLGGPKSDTAHAIGKGAGGTVYLAGRTLSAGSGSGDLLLTRIPETRSVAFTGPSTLSVGQADMPYKVAPGAMNVTWTTALRSPLTSTIAMAEGDAGDLQHLLLPMQ